MRRPFNRSPHKRQARQLTGRRAAQRHQAWRARKAGPWPSWIKREAVSAAIAKDHSEGPLS